MANVRVDFQVLKGVIPENMKEEKIKTVFKYFGTHMIFDIKMDGKFTRKVRLVAGRNKTEPHSPSLTLVLWPGKVLDWD